jgi:hypothetical protein
MSNNFKGSLMQLVVFLFYLFYICFAIKLYFYRTTESYFRASFFNFISLAKIAYLWLVFPNPYTNLYKRAYILLIV